MSSIILLSGPIASGKTTLAKELIERHGFQRLKSSDHLKDVCTTQGEEISRATLQKSGDHLDLQTDYRWLVSDVALPQIGSQPTQTRWLIDAVRKPRQIEHFQAEFGPSVLHVHVSAPEDVLRARYDQRRAMGGDHEGTTTYEEAVEHPNEVASRSLRHLSDLLIDLSEVDPAEAAVRIVEHLVTRP